MTVPNDTSFDPTCHLALSDIALDHPSKPSTVRVRIKASKTDPFRRGVDIFLGRTGADLCPVSSLLSYLCERGSSEGPLFVFTDGKPLTRGRFVEYLKKGLELAGINPSLYSGHSFRIGAATTAAKKGAEDCIIKTLGRWESSAYLQYVRLSRDQLVGVSNILAAP